MDLWLLFGLYLPSASALAPLAVRARRDLRESGQRRRKAHEAVRCAVGGQRHDAPTFGVNLWESESRKKKAIFGWLWLAGGWPLWKMMDFVNWDGECNPIFNGNIWNWWQPNHQPDGYVHLLSICSRNIPKTNQDNQVLSYIQGWGCNLGLMMPCFLFDEGIGLLFFGDDSA